MALTAGRKIQDRAGRQFAWPLGAGAVVFQGSLAMLKAGVLMGAVQQANAGAAATCVVVGIVEKLPPYDPANPTPPIPIRTGTFLFLNSAGADAIALSAVGQAAYAVDDETVALTSDTNVRPKAGIIVDVESDGVWVRVGV